ncbi:MAG: hypothetical protein Q8T08_07115, partial [Ignavibacteria bacterium]|nr:hypothetical protein [Ignavibacteria bacterium]
TSIEAENFKTDSASGFLNLLFQSAIIFPMFLLNKIKGCEAKLISLYPKVNKQKVNCSESFS